MIKVILNGLLYKWSVRISAWVCANGAVVHDLNLIKLLDEKMQRSTNENDEPNS